MISIQNHYKEMKKKKKKKKKKNYMHASNFSSKFEFTGNESAKLSMCSDIFPVSLNHNKIILSINQVGFD